MHDPGFTFCALRSVLLLKLMDALDHELILQKINQQQELLEKIYKSVEKTRKYFMWTLIATVITFVLPLIGLLFAVPYYLQTVLPQYQSILNL